MATVNKDFRIKNGLVVEGSTATVNGKNIITAGVVDAKGDLIVGSADDAVARLGVGTNGQVLTAASGATYGVQWADPAAVGVFGESIVFEGATADAYETTLAVTDPTADRTITFKDASGTVAFTSDIPSSTTGLSEGTNLYFTDERAQDAIGSNVGTGLSYNDTTGAISVTANTYDAYGAAGSAQTAAESTASGYVSTHANLTEAHGATGAVVGTTNTQTLTNKTLTSPVINTPTGITKSDVGLANVDNTTDANKPVSTATQTALDAKLALAGGTMTGAIAMGTNKITGLGTPTNANDAATKTYVDGVITSLVDGAPALLDTLNELAAAINDDANYSTTLTTALGNKQDKVTNVSDTEIGYLDGVTSAIQTQLNDKSTASKTETFTNKTISGADNTLSVRIANDVTGLGTGVATFLTTPSSANLASALTDESGTSTVAFTNSPTFVTPTLGAAKATSIEYPDSLAGSSTATAGTSATTVDTWSATTYSSAKYLVQMKKSGDIETIEVLVTVDGANNVYVTEYADVISNATLGTVSAAYSAGDVTLTVAATAAGTSVKLHKTYIEA